MLQKILPGATEQMSYGMPAFLVQGKGVVAYAGFKEHCSYFPMSGSILTQLKKPLGGYSYDKGTLRFAVDRSLPLSLVKTLVKARLAEISDIQNGKRMDFFPDGRLKAAGAMKDGKLHGHWKWFRKDGTLMRKGQFKQGVQVGTWETWSANGKLVKETRIPHTH
jgi:uncharacterized protein YdhG (YjbR/CyaY superfamily)